MQVHWQWPWRKCTWWPHFLAQCSCLLYFKPKISVHARRKSIWGCHLVDSNHSVFADGALLLRFVDCRKDFFSCFVKTIFMLNHQTFSTTKGKSINLHFLLMERDPEATGKLIVKEGQFGAGRLIGEYDVSNGSFPQSVRTRSSTMWIKFEHYLPRGGCKTFPPCLRFLLRLSANNGE